MRNILLDYSLIIWDWNGTLLDDVEISVKLINHMLSKRNLKQIESSEEYRKYFNFPVIDYYRHLGFNFNKESYDLIAKNYMDDYLEATRDCNLFNSAESVLAEVKRKGINQVIVSALRQERLNTQTSRLSIGHYFNEIIGTSDDYGSGKIKFAEEYIKSSGADPLKTVIIGDTTHDAEVAKALSIDSVLICGGHMSMERLKATGYPVAANITDLL